MDLLTFFEFVAFWMKMGQGCRRGVDNFGLTLKPDLDPNPNPTQPTELH